MPIDNQKFMATIILKRTERCVNSIPPNLVDEIRTRLLDVTNSQSSVVEWLLPYCAGYTFAIVQRAVHTLCQTLLSDDERANRRQVAQTNNNRAAHDSPNANFSAFGKMGAKVRVDQWKEAGVNPAGHSLWSDNEISQLTRLLQDEAYHVNNKPNYVQVAKTFISINESTKSLDAVRRAAMRLWKKLQTAIQSV